MATRRTGLPGVPVGIESPDTRKLLQRVLQRLQELEDAQTALLEGDITLSGAGSGLIVTTPDGSAQYRIRVDDAGNVVSEII